MLDWLISHHLTSAQHTVNDVIGEAERRFGLPRDVTARSLRTALALAGKLGEGAYDEFFERTLPPARTTDRPLRAVLGKTPGLPQGGEHKVRDLRGSRRGRQGPACRGRAHASWRAHWRRPGRTTAA
jgi:hypothetical protein